MANVLSGLLQGMPVGAGYSASAANEAVGARTRWAGLMAAAAVGIMVAVFRLGGQYPRARAGCCGHLGSQPYSAVGHAGAIILPGSATGFWSALPCWLC